VLSLCSQDAYRKISRTIHTTLTLNCVSEKGCVLYTCNKFFGERVKCVGGQHCSPESR